MHTYMKNTMPTREDILHFLSTSTEQQILGYGYGHGISHGFGYIHGSGDGSGYDEEHGSGSCRSGSSSGFSTGYGCGDGSGGGSSFSTGYGCGDGSGCGYAIGDGDGDISYNCYNKDIKVFNCNMVDYINNIPTIITQVHYNIAYGYIVKKDLTLEPCFIVKVGSSFGLRKTIKDAFDDAKNNEMEILEEYFNSELRNLES